MKKTPTANPDSAAANTAPSVTVVAPRIISFAEQLKFVAAPLLIAVCWWAALGGLAALSANPTTINIFQLRRCDRIVRIRSDDPSSNKAEIIATWDAGQWTTLDQPEVVTINNLAESDVTVGTEWHVPLKFIDGEKKLYEVATFKLGGTGPNDEPRASPPYVYPVNEEATKMLDDALRRLTRPRSAAENSRLDGPALPDRVASHS